MHYVVETGDVRQPYGVVSAPNDRAIVFESESFFSAESEMDRLLVEAGYAYQPSSHTWHYPATREGAYISETFGLSAQESIEAVRSQVPFSLYREWADAGRPDVAQFTRSHGLYGIPCEDRTEKWWRS